MLPWTRDGLLITTRLSFLSISLFFFVFIHVRAADLLLFIYKAAAPYVAAAACAVREKSARAQGPKKNQGPSSYW